MTKYEVRGYILVAIINTLLVCMALSVLAERFGV